jgi:topoisomerase IV subunit B
MAEQLLEKVKANERVRKELSAIKKEARERAKKVAIRIPKLIDCKLHFSDRPGQTAREETTIFLTEGDSAGGAMIQARDVQTQAIFSLKGKPLNCHGLKRDAIYKNEELYNIMRALGIEDGIEGLRYNKVVIATDADVDGMHIRNLLLTYFLRYFEELVVRGTSTSSRRRSSASATSRRRSTATARPSATPPWNGSRTPEVTRFKGLGEISPKEFKQFIGDDDPLVPVDAGQRWARSSGRWSSSWARTPRAQGVHRRQPDRGHRVDPCPYPFPCPCPMIWLDARRRRRRRRRRRISNDPPRAR